MLDFVIYPLVKGNHKKSEYKSCFMMSYSKCRHTFSVANLSVVVFCHIIYNGNRYSAGFRAVSTAILLNPCSFLIYTMQIL